MSSRIMLAAVTASVLAASSLAAQGPGKVELKEAQPGLISKAAINVDDALKTALASSKGSVTSERIERRGKAVVYVFGIRSNGHVHHVIVDASTGALVKPQAYARKAK